MKKRELFVFAGQSNMMGASVFPPQRPISVFDSYEYKHKARRLGVDAGDFVAAGYPCGEFSYTDEHIKLAYSSENVNFEGKSLIGEYSKTTYFCPAMCNLKNEETHEEYPFSLFSEANMTAGASLAPIFASEWEKKGHACAYAHIAKGATSIFHYFNQDMIEQYNESIRKTNEAHQTAWKTVEDSTMQYGASAYFDRKTMDFFTDAEAHFDGEDLSVKAFVWCQGEAERSRSYEEYKLRLAVLWDHMRRLGFTHFLCVRIGYWGGSGQNNLHEIMRAQEDFCRETDNCYIVTRAMSLMAHKEIDGTDWFVEAPSEEYLECRDSYFGFKNHHVNEKGFWLIAERMAENLARLLYEGEAPLLEKENVSKLIGRT
jgi:hypothetical protein